MTDLTLVTFGDSSHMVALRGETVRGREYMAASFGRRVQLLDPDDGESWGTWASQDGLSVGRGTKRLA